MIIRRKVLGKGATVRQSSSIAVRRFSRRREGRGVIGLVRTEGTGINIGGN